MSYPRFKNIIIDYFMSKDQSILRRNKMFWHTARDDTMYTSMRCISRHEKTQVYGTILPKELTDQTILESKAYQTYYAFASGEKTPKPKYVRKKAYSDTSPKQKLVQATKDTRLKSKAKVDKLEIKKQHVKKPKAKGLAVLSEVALRGLDIESKRTGVEISFKEDNKRSDKVLKLKPCKGTPQPTQVLALPSCNNESLLEPKRVALLDTKMVKKKKVIVVMN
nr:hypothetical protein [Tanacetum cinerariifolium]